MLKKLTLPGISATLKFVQGVKDESVFTVFAAKNQHLASGFFVLFCFFRWVGFPAYLRQLLCICKVIDGDSQEDIQEGV